MFSQPFPGEELTYIGAATPSVRSCKNSFSLEPEVYILTAQTLLARGRIFGRNPDKRLRVFLLVIRKYLYSLCKREWGEPDRKP
jgi:hypothetical protein